MRLMSTPHFCGLTPGMQKQKKKNSLELLKELEQTKGKSAKDALTTALVGLVKKMNSRTVRPFLKALEASSFTPAQNSPLDRAVQQAMKRKPPESPSGSIPDYVEDDR